MSRMLGLAALIVVAGMFAFVCGASARFRYIPPYIETHIHLKGDYLEAGRRVVDFDAAAATAMDSMRKLGIKKCLIMPPPFAPGNPTLYDYRILKGITRKYPNQFAFLGGGGTLNPIIQESVRTGKLTKAMIDEFSSRAHEIARAGAAGFGELTALHLSFRPGHSYEEAPPDHPLFLLLSDIASRYGMPLDLHMEAVERSARLPDGFASPPNARSLKANVAGLERLLAHNRSTKIIWVHAGWDNTGQGSTRLLRTLLSRNKNLFLSLKVHFHGRAASCPLDRGRLKPEWQRLISDFPTRFVVGSDQFYGIKGKTIWFPDSSRGSGAILRQLDPGVARSVAIDNVFEIYRM